MKTGKFFKKIFSFILACLLLLLCGCETESDKIYNELMGSDSEKAELEGDLTIRTMMGDADYQFGFSAVIREFTELHPEVNITVEESVSYSDLGLGDAYEAAAQKLTTELMSGTAPDIIVDMSIFSPKEYVEAGLLYDISEWMENDPDFDKDDYYWNLFEPFIYDGQLCKVPTSVGFNFIWLNGNLVDKGEYEPWDTIDYKEIMALYDRAAEKGLLSEDFTMTHRDTQEGKNLFYSEEIPAFIDSTTGECSFDDPEFLEYLKETKRVPSNRAVDEILGFSGQGLLAEYSSAIKVKNDSLMMIESINMSNSFSDAEDAPENCVGPLILATHEGDVSYYPGDPLIVPKSCKNPELAWEFIKFCIAPVEVPAYSSIYRPEGGVDICNNRGLPVAKENLESYVQLYAKGNIAASSGGFVGFEPDEMKDPLSKKTMKRIDKLVSSMNCVQDEPYGLSDAINEILYEYYATDLVTAEECAEQMQERAWIYLNE